VSTTATTTRRLSVYDGRQPVAIIEQRSDGSWNVSVRDRHVGTCVDRERALLLVATILNPHGSLKGSPP
jgi:hypothetical protein